MIEILNPSNNTDIISNIQNLNINSDKEKEQVQKNINNNLNNNWWYPSKNGKKRILWAGTHIHQSNGYSRVMYYITKYLGAYDDIELTIYGFQNFNHNQNQTFLRSDIHPSVVIHDAYASEEPKRNGFGEKEIGDYIKKHPQDIIIIFNDAIITSALTATLVNECWNMKPHFKLLSYMDQVYAYQRKDYIGLLNTFYDGIIAFTPYWKEIAYKLGIKPDMPIYVFPHGFDHNLYYPIDQSVARLYYEYNDEDFMVLNLNRNQPRKRWDTTIIAWAEFVERHYLVNVKKTLNKSDCKINKYTSRPIKLVVGTMVDGYWDLMDVLENECKLRGIPYEYAKQTIVPVKMPQQLSDRDINILYNACDVGVNSADGEGFGLCGFEGLAIGKAQVSSYVGGMREFLNEGISIIIKPKVNIYLDCKNNNIGGIAELCDPHDFAEAFWKYFSNPELMNKHATKGRQHILTNYRWEAMIKYLHSKIISVL
uniref:Glycosyl transferase family 1 domain-containing protein n=1 Tax=viral metagenome TaxID=1070528 RepID=A0A6C0CEG7_9ZZZZ